jgi:glycosyltransferase involved in cell wall biosynthesis
MMQLAVARWATFLEEVKKAGASIIWTAHNLWPHEYNFPELEAQARRLLVASADHVVVHCERAGTALQNAFGKARRLSVIRHPCFEVEVSLRPRGERTRRDEGLILLAFGAVRAYKNLEFLAETFRRCGTPADRLIIAGAPHQSYDLTILRANCAFDARISLYDQEIPDGQLGPLFDAVDVVVFGYAQILSSGAVALAQSYGKPVIAPRLGCMVEVIPSDAGELYTPGCPNSFAAALARIRTRHLDRLGAHGRWLVSQETPYSFAAKLQSIYAELASSQLGESTARWAELASRENSAQLRTHIGPCCCS